MLNIIKLSEASNRLPEPTYEEYLQKFLDEATYYGKNEQLKKAEQLLDEMCIIARTKGPSANEFTYKMLDVAEILRKLFGFDSFLINSSIVQFIVPQFMLMMPITSGCTICHGAIFKYSKIASGGLSTWVVDFDKKHKGIQFKPGTKYGMRMYIGSNMFMDYGEYSMTGAEILSIILHEIGHNFYIGPVKEFTAQVLSLLALGDFIKIIYNILVLEGSAEIDSYFSDSMKTSIMELNHVIGAALGPVNEILTALTIPLSLLTLTKTMISLILSIPFRAVDAFIRYDTEKYSDSFAAAYGYGAELSSCLFKMSRIRIPKVSKNIQSGIDVLYGVYKIPLDIIMVLIDPHPNTPGRLLNSIKYMEAAGAKIESPALRKEYQKDLQSLYKLQDDVIKYRGLNPLKLENKVYAWFQKVCRISDPKELLSTLHPKFSTYRNLDKPIGK